MTSQAEVSRDGSGAISLPPPSPFASPRPASAPTDSRVTNLIQADMSIQLIHKRTQLLISLIRPLPPLLHRMNVPDYLGQVNHPTQQVAQPVERLDHPEELPLRVGHVERGRAGAADPRDDHLGPEGGLPGEWGEVGGKVEGGLEEEAGGGERGGAGRGGRVG